MTAAATGSGNRHLAHKSGQIKSFGNLAEAKDILIVEDELLDADRLTATLHLLLGYDIAIRRATTLAEAADEVAAKLPHVVFLDDLLRPSDTALETIPGLRRAGYTGPVIIISGKVTRRRRAELAACGATDIVHKDDVDSVRLAEALHRVFGRSEPEAIRGGAPRRQE